MKNIIIPKYDSSWEPFFKSYIGELEKIDSLIDGDKFNPAPENILRFSNIPVKDIKVIILGQDTYPQAGVATGRSFEVGNLTSWNSWFRQVSLKHIIQNIYGCYTGKSPYCNFSDIQKEILNGKFKILPPNELFDSWNKQGVMCLNAALTCRCEEPGSHSEYWRDFSEGLLRFISINNPNIDYFIWGSAAKSFIPIIESGKIYSSRHPMMCSSSYSDDFLKNPCFRNTMDKINWLGV